ncbi:MAG: pyrimidine-nucleoside phosphorylase, partial [Anaerolineales bacterium]
MQTIEDARMLAELMVNIAKLAGRRAVALLSNMNQPLGNAVGNALELHEAINTLHGGGPKDFREHCLEVAAQMLTLGGITPDKGAARRMAQKALTGGGGWDRFRALVSAQGGDLAYVGEPEKLPRARIVETVPAPQAGYLAGIHARIVGETAVLLGAGRAKKGDPIDHAVGIIIHHKVGEHVEQDQPLFTIHANDSQRLEEARARLLQAHTWSEQPVERLPLFYGVVSEG